MWNKPATVHIIL